MRGSHFEICANDGIPTNADTGVVPMRLLKSIDNLVCQGSGARDNLNRTFESDVIWYDPNLAKGGVIMPEVIWSDKAHILTSDDLFTFSISLMGTPSVIHTIKSMPASAASNIASPANLAGQK